MICNDYVTIATTTPELQKKKKCLLTTTGIQEGRRQQQLLWWFIAVRLYLDHHCSITYNIPGHAGPFGPKLVISRTTTSCFQ
mmetsp:Transcript_25861/g.40697  ORF Transcript_25861/g.40697 Transcript_25861/m.40697 type:complete len:82 (+) Transcript_25861:235-480(+)